MVSAASGFLLEVVYFASNGFLIKVFFELQVVSLQVSYFLLRVTMSYTITISFLLRKRIFEILTWSDHFKSL